MNTRTTITGLAESVLSAVSSLAARALRTVSTSVAPVLRAITSSAESVLRSITPSAARTVTGLSILALASCSSVKEIAYFQDLRPGVSAIEIANPVQIRVRPKDKLSILVNTDKPQLTDLFNLPYVSRQLGQASRANSTYGTSQGVSGYTVDAQGNINFPVVGDIHIEGLTREQVAEAVRSRLVSEDLVKDPVVTVEFMNLTIDVMGEVKTPGRYNIDKDEITVLDAISLAGDLTIFGQRNSILVLRQENGLQRAYNINLLDAAQVYKSPAYYLQQNDVVYVEPNMKKARESTINGNNIRSSSFWVSFGSLATSIAVLVVNIISSSAGAK